MDQDFYNIYDQQSQIARYNYFEHSDNQAEKILSQKPTGSFSEPFEYIRKDNQEGIEKPLFRKDSVAEIGRQPQIRIKKLINVSQKNRRDYLEARKGTNQETNDLSINVCTLIKSFFKEFEIFQDFERQHIEILNQFKNSKSSLRSLKKLLCNQYVYMNNKQEKNIKQLNQEKSRLLGKFILEKLEQSQEIKKIMLSKKMKFSNKIIFLKYIEKIKRISKCPQNIKSWKNTSI